MTSELETTFDSIFTHAERRPAHPALIAGERIVTYRELKEMVAAIAGGFSQLGVLAGERIGVETHDPIDHFVASIGVMLHGGISVALPNDSAETYEAVLDDAQPRLVITNGLR